MKKYYRKLSSKGEQAKPNMIAVVDSQDMWNKGPQSTTTQCYIEAKELEIEGITLGDLINDYKKLKEESEANKKVTKFFTNFAKQLNQTAHQIKGDAKYNGELKANLMKEKLEKDRLFELIAEEFSEEGADE